MPVDQAFQKPWVVVLANVLRAWRAMPSFSRVGAHSCGNEPQALLGWKVSNPVNVPTNCLKN